MGPKVIIVDDDDVNNFLCTKTLAITNFSDDVTAFLNVDSALTYLRNNIDLNDNLPDIIFLDINMPIKNGWDFLQEYEMIKQGLNKEIKIYMLSSSVYEEDISKAKSMGNVIDYIPKPLNQQILEKIAV